MEGVSAAERVRSFPVLTVGLFRHSAADAWLVAAVLAYAGAAWFGFAHLAPRGVVPSLAVALLSGVGLCWIANTASHNHIHRPLFRSRRANRAFSLLLTVLLGFPQSAWRARHLFHHAGEPRGREPRIVTGRVVREAALVILSWAAFAAATPRVFLLSYLPGYVFGLLLCELQGRMEHRAGLHPERGVSYYGRLHNLLWFNDGHHAEHHRFPAEHWSRLPLRRLELVARASAMPPHLRFLEPASDLPASWTSWVLEQLERVALGNGIVQRFVVLSHEAAFRTLLAGLPRPRRVGIVGGGLFPRTLIVLKRLYPECEVVVIDQSADNVAAARAYLGSRGRQWLGELAAPDGSVSGVSFRVARFRADEVRDLDVLVSPLAFVGDRAQLLRANVRVGVVEHVWAWQRGGASVLVSLWLLKRIRLSPPPPRPSV